MTHRNRLDQVRGSDHVKRGLEVAAVAHKSVALISIANPLDTEVFMNWASDHNVAAFDLTLCPCGNFGSTDLTCWCSPEEIRQHFLATHVVASRYAEVWLEVPVPPYEKVSSNHPLESDETVLARIAEAQAHVPNVSRDLDGASQRLMQAAARQLGGISSVRYQNIIDIVVAVAALDFNKPTQISPAYIAEALQYRPLKREPIRDTALLDGLETITAQLKRLADVAEERNA